MKWLEALKKRPWIAHLLRAQERFSQRLGSQFAAAITYFSVLSMVPILMFAFSVLGLTVTVIRPEWMQTIQAAIDAQLKGSPDLSETIGKVVNNALQNWGTVGVIGVLTAGYSGVGWVANLKSAVRAQWRRDFDLAERTGNVVVEYLKNLGILVALLTAVAATLATSSIATSLAGTIYDLLRLDQVPGGGFLLRVVPVVVALATGFLLFWFLYTVLPETRARRPTLLRGAAVGAVGLALLEYFTSALFGVFTGNAAAALFGPIIALMLFFNLFATLILLVAAWIATEQSVAITTPAPDPAPTLLPPQPEMVNAAVARKSMSVGLGAGYAIGAATGIGLGALIAGLARGLSRLLRR